MNISLKRKEGFNSINNFSIGRFGNSGMIKKTLQRYLLSVIQSYSNYKPND
jgi:hypothetical protein